MSVVRDFCGDGLGRLFHDEPSIVHVGRPGEGIVLRPRHVLHGRADDQSRSDAAK
jgi:methionine aminopeptidase